MAEAPKPPSHAPRPPVRRLDVKELLAGGREIVLLHAREEYRLRLTSNGKLILTK
jgi:hemin uptake protein HemP